MNDGALDNLELEGRLAAQRQLLSWLLARQVQTKEDFADLKSHLDESVPPADHQEDPGAVPTVGHAIQTAAGIEMRALLDPLRARFDDGREEA